MTKSNVNNQFAEAANFIDQLTDRLIDMSHNGTEAQIDEAKAAYRSAIYMLGALGFEFSCDYKGRSFIYQM